MKMGLPAKFLFASLLGTVPVRSEAAQEMALTFGLKGGAGYSKTSQKTGSGASVGGDKAKLGYLGGIGTDISFGTLGLVTDFFYAQRSYSHANNGGETVRQVVVPALVRADLVPIQVSFGAFVAAGVGKVKQTRLGVTVDRDYSGAALEKNDLGLAAGLGFKSPLGKNMVFTVEARALYGLTNTLSQPGSASRKTRTLDVLAGFLL